MKRIALFPGSFDPFTIGHESIVERALPLFDEIVIMVGVNSAKHGSIPAAQRVEWIEELFLDTPKVSAISYSGLTIECCREVGAQFILRGIRSASDLEYEQSLAAINRDIDRNIESVILLTDPQHFHISSSVVRELLTFKQPVEHLLPKKYPTNKLIKLYNSNS